MTSMVSPKRVDENLKEHECGDFHALLSSEDRVVGVGHGCCGEGGDAARSVHRDEHDNPSISLPCILQCLEQTTLCVCVCVDVKFI